MNFYIHGFLSSPVIPLLCSLTFHPIFPSHLLLSSFCIYPLLPFTFSSPHYFLPLFPSSVPQSLSCLLPSLPHLSYPHSLFLTPSRFLSSFPLPSFSAIILLSYPFPSFYLSMYSLSDLLLCFPLLSFFSFSPLLCLLLFSPPLAFCSHFSSVPFLFISSFLWFSFSLPFLFLLLSSSP